MADTAKVWPYKKAPKELNLFGDPAIQRESAEHIINFPGGSFFVCRTSDGQYWAHIHVNNESDPDFYIDSDIGRKSKEGVIVGSRIDTNNGVFSLDEDDVIYHIAFKIKTK